jgi:glycosyltransferase involved in cell wall biosynthesis
VVAYNRKELLKECIESARNQTYSNFEIVLVNDGSTEDLREIGELCEVYYEQEHKGISAARNMAMDLAKGDYFFVLDSDDLLEPTCLEEELKLAQETDADYVFCELPIIGETGNVLGEFPCKVQTLEELFEQKFMPHPSSLFKRESVQGLRYDEELDSAVDYDFLMKFMLSGKHKIKKLNKPLYLYRAHHQGQETGTKRQVLNALKIRQKYYDVVHRTT